MATLRAFPSREPISGASHAMYVSHPKEVAAAIEDAAAHAQQVSNTGYQERSQGSRSWF